MCEFSIRKHPHAQSEPDLNVCSIACVQHNLPTPCPFWRKVSKRTLRKKFQVRADSSFYVSIFSSASSGSLRQAHSKLPKVNPAECCRDWIAPLPISLPSVLTINWSMSPDLLHPKCRSLASKSTSTVFFYFQSRSLIPASLFHCVRFLPLTV